MKRREQRLNSLLTCERKRDHYTKASADEHLAQLLAARADNPNWDHSREDKHPLTVYLCPHAKPKGRHWHVGHKPYWLDLTPVERLLNKRLQ